MSSFVIRDAVLEDADAIARVSAESWRSSYRGILPDEVLVAIDVEKRAAKRREILMTGEGLHLVVHDEGELVGFCDAGPDRGGQPGRGEVYAIYLLDRAQRRGLGRMLFGRARAWLSAHGMAAMSVWVIENNFDARCFYEALGGQPAGSKQIELSGVAVTELAYEWDEP
ncbi:MAG TPA: GNAT family N-acetyltransferase [Kofleriaceae bacterium]